MDKPRRYLTSTLLLVLATTTLAEYLKLFEIKFEFWGNLFAKNRNLHGKRRAFADLTVNTQLAIMFLYNTV
jgi:hypothetical protein